MAKRERFEMNKVDDRWCVVLTGEGYNDFRRLTERLTLSRIPWENDSDDLSLELVDPTITQVMSTQQLCRELNRSKLEGSW